MTNDNEMEKKEQENIAGNLKLVIFIDVVTIERKM